MGDQISTNDNGNRFFPKFELNASTTKDNDNMAIGSHIEKEREVETSPGQNEQNKTTKQQICFADIHRQVKNEMAIEEKTSVEVNDGFVREQSAIGNWSHTPLKTKLKDTGVVEIENEIEINQIPLQHTGKGETCTKKDDCASLEKSKEIIRDKESPSPTTTSKRLGITTEASSHSDTTTVIETLKTAVK